MTAANPWKNLFYASEVPGVFKSISLTSYSPGQPMTVQEQQYKWLEAELKAVRAHQHHLGGPEQPAANRCVRCTVPAGCCHHACAHPDADGGR